MNFEEVVLSDGGKYSVGPIRWGAYKPLRELVTKAIAGDVPRVLTAFVAILDDLKGTDGETKLESFQDFQRVFDFEKLKSVLEGAEIVNEVLVEAWPVLIKGCVRSELLTDGDLDDLSAPDLFKLGAAAVRQTDFGQLLSIEGNSLAAAVTAAKATTTPASETPTGSKT